MPRITGKMLAELRDPQSDRARALRFNEFQKLVAKMSLEDLKAAAHIVATAKAMNRSLREIQSVIHAFRE